MNGSALSVHTGHHRWGIGAVIAFLLLCAIFLVLFLNHNAAAVDTVPKKINFQGRLTDSSGNIVANGQYNATFRLFTVSSGGSAVWTEVRGEGTSPVQVTNGLFSVQLGDVTPIPPSLFASGNLYFEIELPSTATATCNTASCANYTGNPNVMSPRNPLATSAYAFNSDTLDGLDSAAFIQGSANNTLTGTNLFQMTNAAAVKIQNAGGTLDLFVADTSGGKVGIGLANPTLGKLHVSWVTGDAVPAIYGGASSGSNNQIGVYGRSGSGTGVQGVSGSGIGVQGSSTSNIGILGASTSSVGVQGRSDTSTSGLFLSTNTAGGNSSATLVTRASVNQPGDLFQAQDSGNNSLFKIAVDGSVRTKVGTGLDSTTAFVVQNAGGIALLTADSVNNRIYLGNTTADATGVVLVLDTKNTAGDPTGVDGAMYYNSNLGKFRCYQESTWYNCVSPGGLYDYKNSYYYQNDFLATGQDGTLFASTSGGTVNPDLGVAAHPGIIKVTTGVTTTGRASLSTGTSSGNIQPILLANGVAWTTRAVIQLYDLSDASNPATYRVGFIDNPSGETVDGCFFRYTHSVNSGKWEGVCADGTGVGSISTCDTGITAATTVWKTMEVGVNSAGTTATFAIDGTQVCTVTSAIPTGSSRKTGFGLMVLKGSLGTSERALGLDYMDAAATGLSR